MEFSVKQIKYTLAMNIVTFRMMLYHRCFDVKSFFLLRYYSWKYKGKKNIPGQIMFEKIFPIDMANEESNPYSVFRYVRTAQDLIEKLDLPEGTQFQFGFLLFDYINGQEEDVEIAEYVVKAVRAPAYRKAIYNSMILLKDLEPNHKASWPLDRQIAFNAWLLEE